MASLSNITNKRKVAIVPFLAVPQNHSFHPNALSAASVNETELSPAKTSLPPLEPSDLPNLEKAKNVKASLKERDEREDEGEMKEESAIHYLFNELGISAECADNFVSHNFAIADFASLTLKTLKGLIPDEQQRSKLLNFISLELQGQQEADNINGNGFECTWETYLFSSEQAEDLTDNDGNRYNTTVSSRRTGSDNDGNALNLSDTHSSPRSFGSQRRRSVEEPARLPSEEIWKTKRRMKFVRRRRSITPPPRKFYRRLLKGEEEFLLIPIDRKSAEFSHVEFTFNESLKPPTKHTFVIPKKKGEDVLLRCELIGLRKVINPKLEKRFELAKLNLAWGYYSQYAFHGAPPKNLENICREGLLPIGDANNFTSTPVDQGNMGNPTLGVNLTSKVDYAATYSRNKKSTFKEGDLLSVIAFKLVLGKSRHYSIRKVAAIPKGKRIVAMCREGDRRGYKYDSYTIDDNRQIFLTKPEQACPLYVFDIKLVRDVRTQEDQIRVVERHKKKIQAYLNPKSPRSFMRITPIPEESRDDEPMENTKQYHQMEETVAIPINEELCDEKVGLMTTADHED